MKMSNKWRMSPIRFVPIVLLLCLISCVSKQTETRPEFSGYAEINGIKLYYEIIGKGEPLLYLHGGLSSQRDFQKYLPEFSRNFKVIMVDRRGHGRSFDNAEPYSYASMAAEIDQFLEYLKMDSVLVIGWSDGGVVGLHLAGSYPSRVKKLIAVGANRSVDGMEESSIEWMKNQLTVDGLSKSIPEIGKTYREINPNPENFGRFISRTREMWLHDPYVPADVFNSIRIPVLLVSGDHEDIRLEHSVEMHAALKNSRLFIIPNKTHFVFAEYDENIADIFIRFLKEADQSVE